MKLSAFSPYGLLSKECGLLFLVSNYLAKNGADVSLLRCDGAVQVCGRDRHGAVVRTPFQCARCSNEQRALALWAGMRMRDLSADTNPDDLTKTASWLQGVPKESLLRVEFRGVNLWSVCRSEFGMRWEEVDAAALSDSQERDLRGLFASYVRVAVASERFLSAFKPTLSLVTSLRDPLSHAFVAQARAAQIDTAVFSYDPEDELVVVESLATEERYVTKLVLEGVTAMRADPRTWAPEVTSVVHELLTFLGYAPDRVL